MVIFYYFNDENGACYNVWSVTTHSVVLLKSMLLYAIMIKVLMLKNIWNLF